MQPSHFKMLLTTAFFNEIATHLHDIVQSHIVNKVIRYTSLPLPTWESHKEDSDGDHCFLILMPTPNCLLTVIATAPTSKLISKQKMMSHNQQCLTRQAITQQSTVWSTLFGIKPFSTINFCWLRFILLYNYPILAVENFISRIVFSEKPPIILAFFWVQPTRIKDFMEGRVCYHLIAYLINADASNEWEHRLQQIFYILLCS